MVFSCGRTTNYGRCTAYTADHPCIPKPHKMETWSNFWDLRLKQGYTVAMAVEESRLLQVTIFSTLHKNTNNLEFSALLPDVVTIADEVDAQLKEQMLRFMAADAAKGK